MVTQHYGVCRKEDFPDQGRRKTSREAFEFRARVAERRNCRVQYRARVLYFSAELQIDFEERGIEVDQAGAGGVYGDQREFDKGAAPADRGEHRASAAERAADVWIFERTSLVWRDGRGGGRVRGRVGCGNAGDDAERGI